MNDLLFFISSYDLGRCVVGCQLLDGPDRFWDFFDGDLAGQSGVKGVDG